MDSGMYHSTFLYNFFKQFFLHINGNNDFEEFGFNNVIQHFRNPVE